MNIPEWGMERRQGFTETRDDPMMQRTRPRVDFETWANPQALHQAYILHPAAERQRVDQCDSRRAVPFVLFAARDLSNLIRTLVALHPEVAADLSSLSLWLHAGQMLNGRGRRPHARRGRCFGVDLLTFTRDSLEQENG